MLFKVYAHKKIMRQPLGHPHYQPTIPVLFFRPTTAWLIRFQCLPKKKKLVCQSVQTTVVHTFQTINYLYISDGSLWTGTS